MNTNVYETFSFKDFLSKMFSLMTIGLLITTLTSWLIGNELFYMFYVKFPYLPLVCAVVEIVLVIYFSANLYKLSKVGAYACFFIYSILNGCTLSYIFLAYTDTSVVVGLALTTILFLCMSIIGHSTKIDLSKFTNIFRIALIFIIVVSIVNFFIGSSLMEWAVSCLGILVFLGLVAYDTQKLHYLYNTSYSDPEMSEKVAIYGALELYLDFINIFIRILQIFGKRRD